MKRVILAYVLAPPTAGIAFLIMSVLFDESADSSLAMASGVAIYSYIPSLLFGTPTHLVLRKHKKESLRSYKVIGVSVGVVWALIARGFTMNSDTLVAVFTIAFPCGLVAASFSIIKNGWSNQAIGSIGTSSVGPDRIS